MLMADDNFYSSKVIVDNKQTESSLRTSMSHYIQFPYDNVTKTIEKKVNKFLNFIIGEDDWIPLIEHMQIVKYEIGQEFKEHYDYAEGAFQKNQRRYTIFVYLNDVEEGGETKFSQLDKFFFPKEKNAVFWENHDEAGKCYPESIHCGKPPIKGKKYGLNIWIGCK
jgi:prolyl 4-hydroxylase